MSDVRARELAQRQFNRVSRQQLIGLGMTDAVIANRVAAGALVIVEQGVLAFAPVLEHDPWGRWMGATLTAPGSVLSHASATAAWGFWAVPRQFEIVTRPGNGGPKRHGGVLAFRSSTLDGNVESLNGIPITTVSRTLLDIACHISDRALARALREAVRLKLVSVDALAEFVGGVRGRRGSRRLTNALGRYSGLPLERARSGAEVRALEILRDAGSPLPQLNVRIAGEEADLSWPSRRVIIEIDGGPFHLDVGEDARKERIWEAAGWAVRRISSTDVYERPYMLMAIAPAPNVAQPPL
jgi:hypothetical protein